MRACEYTCDRYAAYYVGNLEASKEALVLLAIGKKLSSKVNQEAFVEQISEESGFFAWLSEKLASHPHLPKRINALDHWFQPEQHPLVQEKKIGVVIGVTVSLVLLASVTAAVIIAEKSTAIADFFAWVNDSEDIPAYEENISPFSQAVAENNTEKIQQFIADGTNLEETDYEGWTALHYAASYGNLEAAKTLLDNGANVNAKDNLDETALILAVTSDTGSEMKMAQLLLDYGANLSLKDSDGWTAYDYAVDDGDDQLSKLLKKQVQEEL